MNAIFQYEKFKGKSSQFTDAVEQARADHARRSEEKILKRALIQNGRHPDYKKGHAKSKEKQG
jgi:hypothetical protein